MSVECWLTPFPFESLVKKPVPWMLTSWRCSWAVAPETLSKIARHIPTEILRLTFLLLV